MSKLAAARFTESINAFNGNNLQSLTARCREINIGIEDILLKQNSANNHLVKRIVLDKAPTQELLREFFLDNNNLNMNEIKRELIKLVNSYYNSLGSVIFNYFSELAKSEDGGIKGFDNFHDSLIKHLPFPTASIKFKFAQSIVNLQSAYEKLKQAIPKLNFEQIERTQETEDPLNYNYNSSLEEVAHKCEELSGKIKDVLINSAQHESNQLNLIIIETNALCRFLPHFCQTKISLNQIEIKREFSKETKEHIDLLAGSLFNNLTLFLHPEGELKDITPIYSLLKHLTSSYSEKFIFNLEVALLQNNYIKLNNYVSSANIDITEGILDSPSTPSVENDSNKSSTEDETSPVQIHTTRSDNVDINNKETSHFSYSSTSTPPPKSFLLKFDHSAFHTLRRPSTTSIGSFNLVEGDTGYEDHFIGPWGEQHIRNRGSTIGSFCLYDDLEIAKQNELEELAHLHLLSSRPPVNHSTSTIAEENNQLGGEINEQD